MPHSGHVQLAIRSLCARESSFRKSDLSAPSAPSASRNPADPSRQRAPPSRRIRGRRTALSPSPVSPRRTARPRPCRNSGSAARTPRRRAATQSTASASLPCFPYQVAGMRNAGRRRSAISRRHQLSWPATEPNGSRPKKPLWRRQNRSPSRGVQRLCRGFPPQVLRRIRVRLAACRTLQREMDRRIGIVGWKLRRVRALEVPEQEMSRA